MLGNLSLLNEPDFCIALQKHGPLYFFEPPEDYFENDYKRTFTTWVFVTEHLFYQGELIDGLPNGRGIFIKRGKELVVCYTKNGLGHGKGFAIDVKGNEVTASLKFGTVHGTTVIRKLGQKIRRKIYVYGQIY